MGALRLILAVSVMVWHLPTAQTRLVDGGVAVLLFFILSGFTMALVLNERYIGTRDFYAARALRIFPPYYAAVALMMAWFIYTHSPTPFTGMDKPLGMEIGWALLNLSLIGQDLYQAINNNLGPGWPTPSPAMAGLSTFVTAHVPAIFFTLTPMIIGQAWSLGSELLFYLVSPFVLRSRRRIALLFLASLALRFILIGAGFHSDIWGYWFAPATFCFFLLGAASYHLYVPLRTAPWLPAAGTGVAIVIATLGLPSLIQHGGILMIRHAHGYDTGGLWLAYFGFALTLPFVFARWKDSAVDRWLGDLSYPLYLVHGFLIGLCWYVIDRPNWAIPVSLLGAAALWFTVDRPLDHWRHHLIGGQRRGGAKTIRAAEAAA